MKQTNKAPFAALAVISSLLAYSTSPALAAGVAPPYALGTLPSGLAVQWPTPPTVNFNVIVHTLAEFNKAAARPNTRIQVDAVITGTGSISASDVEVHIHSGSLGSLRIERSVKRVALIGGQYNGSIEIVLPSTFSPNRVDNAAWNVEDVMIDGITVNNPKGTAFYLRGNRVALLRSYAHAHEYAIYSDSAPKMQNDNLIIAGNDLESDGEQATVRLISARTSVAVDNRFTSLQTNNGKHNYRVHGITGKSFAARNLFVNAGTMLGTMDRDNVGELWFDNNTFHHNSPDLFNVDQTYLHVLHARNNVAYTNVWKCFFCGRVPAAWEITNDVVKPYKAAPAPLK